MPFVINFAYIFNIAHLLMLYNTFLEDYLWSYPQVNKSPAVVAGSLGAILSSYAVLRTIGSFSTV